MFAITYYLIPNVDNNTKPEALADFWNMHIILNVL